MSLPGTLELSWTTKGVMLVNIFFSIYSFVCLSFADWVSLWPQTADLSACLQNVVIIDMCTSKPDHDSKFRSISFVKPQLTRSQVSGPSTAYGRGRNGHTVILTTLGEGLGYTTNLNCKAAVHSSCKAVISSTARTH